MSKFWDKKVDHFIGEEVSFSIAYGPRKRPLCKIDSLTWAYKVTPFIEDVSCIKCLIAWMKLNDGFYNES